MPNIRSGSVGQAMLKNLDQQLIQLAERFHPPEINLHELLDRQGVAVDHAPQCGEFFLMVKEQPVVGATGHAV